MNQISSVYTNDQSGQKTIIGPEFEKIEHFLFVFRPTDRQLDQICLFSNVAYGAF